MNLQSLRRIAAGTQHPADMHQLTKAIAALEHLQTLGHANDVCPTCCRSNKDHVKLVIEHPPDECVPIDKHNRIIANLNRKGPR